MELLSIGKFAKSVGLIIDRDYNASLNLANYKLA